MSESLPPPLFKPANKKTKPQEFTPQTGITKLDQCFKKAPLKAGLIEWGAPKGQFSRLTPLLLLQGLQTNFIWINNEAHHHYPYLLAALKFNLQQVHTVQSKKILSTARQVIDENLYSTVIIDTNEVITKADLNLFAHKARQQNKLFFLFRHFFLSPKNGNPFSSQRYNSSFNFKQRHFQLNPVKSLMKKSISFTLHEVLL